MSLPSGGQIVQESSEPWPIGAASTVHQLVTPVGREWAAVIPLIAMMVWMGVYSQSFLPPVSKVTAHVLDQAQVTVPFRVHTGTPQEAADMSFDLRAAAAAR